MSIKAKSERKTKGRVYTPDFIVRNILDMVEYRTQNILKKNVIDNSCGDGAFLREIVKRYCEEAINANISKENIKSDLEKHIFGIELDEHESMLCKQNLEKTANQYGIHDVAWNILCKNTLFIDKYNGKMDFVVGNPPYVRIHNLDDSKKVKSFNFTKEGMTDLYVVFFEIGIKMLNKSGRLGYITPSSYFTSKSGRVMRNYLIAHNLLTDIVDMKHHQIFDASTYTAITILKKNRVTNTTNYYEYNLDLRTPYLVDTLDPKEFYICGNFYFSKKENLLKLKQILLYSPIFTKDTLDVKNGFATLCDAFFIQDSLPFDDYVIPVLKGSTGKWKKCFFPYQNGKLVSLQDLQKNISVKNYYLKNEMILKKRNLEKKEEWWGFGRTQGINDVYKTKYAINSLIRTPKDIKLVQCDDGVGIYSGLYILTNKSFQDIERAITSDDFMNYVELLGKYKSGGYYTFSSKDVKQFLNYTLLKG